MLKLETNLHTKEEMKKIVANLWKVINERPWNKSAILSAEEINVISQTWSLLDHLYTDTFDEEY